MTRVFQPIAYRNIGILMVISSLTNHNSPVFSEKSERKPIKHGLKLCLWNWEYSRQVSDTDI